MEYIVYDKDTDLVDDIITLDDSELKAFKKANPKAKLEPVTPEDFYIEDGYYNEDDEDSELF